MIDIDVGFVILHYQAYKDTFEAVDSILNNIDTDSFRIVIVDNASPNGSGVFLLDNYKDNPKVSVILNENNLGFAKGNNIGYRYLKTEFNAKYIVLLNNDIIFLEQHFFYKLQREYSLKEYCVLGPMILTADGKYNSSPIRISPITEDEVMFAISEYKKNLILNKLFLWPVYLFIKKLTRKKSRSTIKPYSLYRSENVQIHGCAIVFSDNYITRHENALFDKTFLYCEEDILFLNCLRYNERIIYCPDIVLFHKEDASTDYDNKTSRKKNIFYYTEALKSEYILLDIVREYEKIIEPREE